MSKKNSTQNLFERILSPSSAEKFSEEQNTQFEQKMQELDKISEQKQAELKNEKTKYEAKLAALNSRFLLLQTQEKEFEDMKNAMLEKWKFQEQEKNKARQEYEAKLDSLWGEKCAEQDKQLEKRRIRCLEEQDKMLKLQRDEAAERQQNICNDIEQQHKKLLQAEIDRQQKFRDEQNALLDTMRANLKEKEQHITEQENELNKQQSILDNAVKQMNMRQLMLDDEYKNIQQRVENLAKEKNIDLQRQFSLKEREVDELRARIQHKDEAEHTLAVWRQKFGEKSPEEILRDLAERDQHIKELQNKILNCPGEDLQARYNELLAENNRLEKEVTANHLELQQIRSFKQDFEEQAFLNENLCRERDHYKNHCMALQESVTQMEEDLKRLQTQHGKKSTEEERIKAIEEPYVTLENCPPLISNPADPRLNEMIWLEGIADQCTEYGFKFPKRILYAFHTSLKAAEFSSLSVLSGVSGTGKSELPRLYSLFGGINFIMESVQPNWDSLESMLGFFNPIDNVFDAKPLLRFLAQSQKERTDAYPGMKDAINLVLLDEMNLAHIELYFAEFLSKLESRRATSLKYLPKLPINLGAGMSPYDLNLGRNVLWAGTMNQDETTKALSDKVLDRSGVIHFPRPSVLKRRLDLTKHPLPSRPKDLLPYNIWAFKWTRFDTLFTDEAEINPYKKFIEEINKALGSVGRALGHRVWQSIEYYMSNYPSLIYLKNKGAGTDELQKTMHIAFEDQLVQKVMPKLRGIETRGMARNKCLDPILRLLDENQYSIVYDFQKACEQGYGQFIWNSADYLEQYGDEIGLQADELKEIKNA